MLKRFLSLCFIPTILCSMPLPTLAQITPDASLGAEQSTLSPTNTIEGGARRGANLFHSFSQFNIGDRQRIDFTNPAGVDRIITRVTGNTRSEILGTLGILGKADLFLLNPNGIVFGKDARLDLGGSFVASTMDGVIFDQGFAFSSTNPQAPPLLTISAPIGLQASRRPAAIAAQGATLVVPSGKTLALIGGDVTLEGATLSAAEGRVELGGLAETGRVEFNSSVNTPIRFAENAPRADIRLNAAQIFVDGGGKGDATLNARNILIDQSFIGAGILDNLGSVERRAGDITLNASEAITIRGASLILNVVEREAIGTGGNINVATGSLSLSEGSQISALVYGQGATGNISLRATGAVTLDGQGDDIRGSRIFSASAPGGIGNSGNITLSANSLSIVRGGLVLSSVFGTGNGGNVEIRVQDAIAVDGANSAGGTSGIASQVGPGGVGDGGNLQIFTRSLAVTQGGVLSTSTNGRGNAGNLSIQATEIARFDGEIFFEPDFLSISRANSQVQENGIGNAGKIEITTPSLILRNGAQISNSTFGQGNAGNVTLNAETMDLDGAGQFGFGSGVSSAVELGAIGNGGNLVIRTGSLALTNGAGLSVVTDGQGKAGTIDILTRDSTVIAGTSPNQQSISGVFGRVNPNGVGQGGDINLTTGSLAIRDRARLSTSTQGQGNAGTVRITARDAVSIIGSGDLNSSSGVFSDVTPGAIGNGGNIFISADRLIAQRNAQIGVSAEGNGQAGNLQIQANSLKLSEGSLISAATTSNQGGNILLNLRDSLLLRQNSQISTTAGLANAGGDGGNIDINAGFVIALPNENSDITANAFTGRGGNITITTQGIFGIGIRDRPTDSSDITASSRFGINGVVTLNQLALTPTPGTIELPTRFSSPPVAQGCQASSRTGRFVNEGRGGVSASPADPLIAETIWQDWELIDQPQAKHTPEIVEAQGWVKQSDGTVALVYDRELVNCPISASK